MSHYLLLNVTRDNNGNVNKIAEETITLTKDTNQGKARKTIFEKNTNSLLNITPRVPNIKETEETLYTIFDEFMHDKEFIRFGVNESTVTWRLSRLFNLTKNQNISFNCKLPQLMELFMIKNPQYNISKKVRNSGTMYLGVGLVDDIPNKRDSQLEEDQLTGHALSVTEEEKEKQRDRYKRRRLKKLEILEQIRIEILQRTRWSNREYQQLVNLGFITVLQNHKEYNIEGTIELARGNIIRYSYDKIYALNRSAKSAQIVKHEVEKAITRDEYLTIQHKFPTYTNRELKAAVAYATGENLRIMLTSYANSMNNMPQIAHIVYPDIQYLSSVAQWLKDHGEYKTRSQMAKTQNEFEPAEDIETDNDKAIRILEAETFVTKLMYPEQH